MSPFVKIIFKDDVVRSKSTQFGGDNPFWDFKHDLVNIKSVDEVF